jgi:hypothetical protein
MSNAIIGTGILLKAGDGATPEVFTTVAEIVSLKPSSYSRNKVDVSNHNEARESNILGMLRQSDVTGTCNLVPSDATHTLMRDDIKNNVKRNWRITYPPAGLPHDTFPGRVQLFEEQEVTTDAPLQFAFSIALDGDIVRVG